MTGTIRSVRTPKMLTYIVLVAVFSFGVSQAAYNCSDPPIFPNYDMSACCRVPKIDMGSTPEKCIKEIDAIKPFPDFPSYAHVCYPECIYRESGALKDGQIQMDKVQKFLQSQIQGVDKLLLPVIIQSFENCIKNIREHMNAANVQMYPTLPEGCSPYSSMIWGCVNTDTFVNCPERMWKNDQECNTARGFVNECNPLPHVPLPMF